MPAFFPAYEGGELVGFLTLFAPTRQEAEVTAFVRPDRRRRGCFNAMRAEASRVCREYGVPALSYAVEAAGTTGLAAVRALPRAVFQRSEYQMLLAEPREAASCDPADPGLRFAWVSADGSGDYALVLDQALELRGEEPVRFIRALSADPQRSAVLLYSEGRPVGVYHSTREEGGRFISGVGVAADARGRGYGEALLRRAAADAAREGLPLRLDVGSENAAALGLYKKLGFAVTFQMDYYSQPI